MYVVLDARVGLKNNVSIMDLIFRTVLTSLSYWSSGRKKLGSFENNVNSSGEGDLSEDNNHILGHALSLLEECATSYTSLSLLLVVDSV
jgi:hypothetical protein